MPKHKKLMDDELVSLIEQEKAELSTEGLGIIEQQRSSSNLAYQGEYSAGISASPLSSLIVDCIKPAVDTHTAFITNPFTRKDSISMMPVDPQMSVVADQVNKLLNHTVHRMNHDGLSGYSLIKEWVQSAALNKNGIWKVSWDTTPVTIIKEIMDVSPIEIDAYTYQLELEGNDVEIIEENVVETEVGIEAEGPEVDIGVSETSYEGSSYTIKCSYPRNQVKYEIIPPEEFLINEDAEWIGGRHCRYVAHRQLLTVSDIIEMFPDLTEDKINEMAASGPADDLEYNYERLIRGQSDGTYDTVPGRSNTTGPNRQLEVTESFIQADRNGDGIAEWRHCYTVGHTLIMDEEWDGPLPFVSFTFFKTAHKHHGQSIYDRIWQYLRAKTGLGRAHLDMLTLQNTPRFLGNEEMVNEQDFQVIKPGLIKTRKGFQASDIVPLPMPQGNPQTIQLLQFFNQEIAAQLIIDPYTGAISAEAEKSGNAADKTAMVIDNASAKAEAVIRDAGEGLKKIAWLTLNMYIKNSNEPEVQKLINELTPGIPFLAAEDKIQDNVKYDDFICNVGLGNLNGQQKFQRVGALFQLTQAATQMGVQPNPVKVLNLLHEAAKGAGFDNSTEFFDSPQEYQMSQQEKAPLMQMQLQAAQLELQNKQLEGQKIQAELRKITSEAVENETDAQVMLRKQDLDEWEAQIDAQLTAESLEQAEPGQMPPNIKVG